MTCQYYSKQGERIFCNILGGITEPKERECLGDYSLCLTHAKEYIKEKGKKDLEALGERRGKEQSECMVNLHVGLTSLAYINFPTIPTTGIPGVF